MKKLLLLLLSFSCIIINTNAQEAPQDPCAPPDEPIRPFVFDSIYNYSENGNLMAEFSCGDYYFIGYKSLPPGPRRQEYYQAKNDGITRWVQFCKRLCQMKGQTISGLTIETSGCRVNLDDLEECFRNNKVEKLYIRNNDYFQDRIIHLPSFIFKEKSLKYLLLYHVNVPIPPEIAQLKNLEFFYLEEGHVERPTKTFPTSLLKLGKLKSLIISSICYDTYLAIPDGISKLKNLETLSIDCLQRQGLNLKSLKKLKKLKRLSVGPHIEDERDVRAALPPDCDIRSWNFNDLFDMNDWFK